MFFYHDVYCISPYFSDLPDMTGGKKYFFLKITSMMAYLIWLYSMMVNGNTMSISNGRNPIPCNGKNPIP